MLHPATLMRLSVYAGVAFLVRAIVREAAAERQAIPMLPPAKPVRSRTRSRRSTLHLPDGWDDAEIPASDPPAR